MSEAIQQAPYLLNFLNFSLHDEQLEKIKYLDNEGLRQRTFIALRAFFDATAQHRPHVILLDDLQWLDGASLDLLTYLLPLSSSRPILWLLLFRPERQKGVLGLHEALAADPEVQYQAIHLLGLQPAEAEQLLSNLLLMDNVPAEVAQLILSRAEGNPLYLEEVIRALINDELLQRDENGRWHLPQNVSSISVPDTLEGVLMARLDRLAELCRWSVQVASVIGRTFPYDVLNEATAPIANVQLEVQLTHLQWVEMIQEQQRQPERVYSFIHSLLQEVAYRSQSLKARQQVHQLIAEYLETGRDQGWGDVESLIPLIAHHAYQGGRLGAGLALSNSNRGAIYDTICQSGSH